jgi:hypothetical protein
LVIGLSPRRLQRILPTGSHSAIHTPSNRIRRLLWNPAARRHQPSDGRMASLDSSAPQGCPTTHQNQI